MLQDSTWISPVWNTNFIAIKGFDPFHLGVARRIDQHLACDAHALGDTKVEWTDAVNCGQIRVPVAALQTNERQRVAHHNLTPVER
jgi:hypothetical protein